MQQKKALLLASACGAVVGALVVRFSSNLTARFPVFTLDRALLARHRYLLPTIPWI
jgi:hypothetical protein